MRRLRLSLRLRLPRRLRVWLPSLLFVVWSAAAGAWDWPLDTPDVKQSFLSLYRGRHHNGLIIDSRTSSDVSAVEDGVVIFAAARIDRPHTIRTPHALGGIMVVEHAGRFRTVYGNVRSMTDGGRVVRQRERIARIDHRAEGDGAAATGGALNLLVIDERQRSFINPLLLFPRLLDTLRPTVYSFTVQFRQSPIIGRYFNVHVGTFDRRVFSQSVTPILPPFVGVYYQQQTQEIFLDSVRSDGRYLYNSATAIIADDLFTADGQFILGPFVIDEQEEIMEIRISDYAMLSRSIRVSIYEDEDERPQP